MKVAVVGTGLMGMGIAQVFATHGDEVMMCIVTGKDPEGKKAKFAKGFTRLVQKGKMTQEEVDEIMGRVTFGGLDIAADADLVVESALEDMDAKIEVFKKLDENDKRAEERSIQTHRRLDPLVEEIGRLRGKVEIVEKAAMNATMGGKK